jgi:hypothetical protein
MEQTITSYYIYPAIGIARVGNSPDQYFVGPEVPGEQPPLGFNFKDSDGQVKRQAAKFRVYGLDKDGNVVKEIVNDDNTEIHWNVHLANRKAINYEFNNAMDLGKIALESVLRNKTMTSWKKREQNLLIDPGARDISGNNQGGKKRYKFDDGEFYGKAVPLGELKTDDQGRLLVLGGFGHSASYKGPGDQATTFANNDGWHDDVSDGPVRASIIIKNGDCEETIEAKPAMVAVTPPNFAPGLRGVVTMYDVVMNLFYQNDILPKPKVVEFWRDIHPIFDRLVQNQAVNEGLYFQFGQNSPGDLNQPDLLKKLASSAKSHKALRQYIFLQFRDPQSKIRKDAKQPPFYGDAFNDFPETAIVNLSVTDTQYEQLQRWADGDFKADTNYRDLPQTLNEVPLPLQPQALTATNLLECLGGPFHPGIELTWFLRRLSMWNIEDKNDPLRLNILPQDEQPQDNFGPILRPKKALRKMFNASGPGTLTRFMGVPWQTDEASCRSGYDTALYLPTPSFWSARVPNQVMSTRSLKRLGDKHLPHAQRLKHMDHRQDWLRFFQGSYQNQINDMVQNWDKIGIVTRQEVKNPEPANGIPETLWVESEVSKDYTDNDPSFKQLLALELLDRPIPIEKVDNICGTKDSKADTNPKKRRVYNRDEW